MTYSELMAAYREYCQLKGWNAARKRLAVSWPSRGPLAERRPKFYGAVSFGTEYVMRHTLPVIDVQTIVAFQLWS